VVGGIALWATENQTLLLTPIEQSKGQQQDGNVQDNQHFGHADQPRGDPTFAHVHQVVVSEETKNRQDE
jgi:hypothetical protein